MKSREPTIREDLKLSDEERKKHENDIVDIMKREYGFKKKDVRHVINVWKSVFRKEVFSLGIKMYFKSAFTVQPKRYGDGTTDKRMQENYLKKLNKKIKS